MAKLTPVLERLQKFARAKEYGGVTERLDDAFGIAQNGPNDEKIRAYEFFRTVLVQRSAYATADVRAHYDRFLSYQLAEEMMEVYATIMLARSGRRREPLDSIERRADDLCRAIDEACGVVLAPPATERKKRPHYLSVVP